MTPSLHIREATAADLTAVLELLIPHLEDHSIVLGNDALRRATQRLIEDPEVGRVLVATAGAQIAGVAVLSFLWTLEHGGAAAWLDELYVRPQWRRAGVGNQLVEASMTVARLRGCIALDLEIEPGHDSAQRLYGRLGFRRHARERWVYPLTAAP